MISIQRYLRPERPKPGDYIRFLQEALNGISLHVADTNQDDLARFRQEVTTVAGHLSDRSTTQEIDDTVDFVIRAGAGYSRIAARVVQAHLLELQAMLGMMTETIAYLSDSSKTGIEQLHVVEDTLQKASNISDIRVLRGKLDNCLTLVRKESSRLRVESHAQIAVIQEGIERSVNHMREAGMALPEPRLVIAPERAPGAHPEDPATGLPGRSAIEDVAAQNLSRGKEFVLAVFVVDRLRHINGRFGRDTGDEVLLNMAQHLGERLETGAFFKWSGPAFAAVLEGGKPFGAIEQQMKNVASLRLEKTVEKDGRVVIVAVTCSVLVQKVSEGDSLTAVFETLDDFVATRG